MRRGSLKNIVVTGQVSCEEAEVEDNKLCWMAWDDGGMKEYHQDTFLWMSEMEICGDT